MATNEDCASVLEQFIHDAANLPAEISHMMEEIQAKDKEMQKHQSIINGKDSNLQKHIKLNGVLQPHPKESEYAEMVKKNFELCVDLQGQKAALSEKACNLLERQIRKFDIKIRELQNDGQLLDGPALPSVFNRKAEPQKSFLDGTANLPLQAASINQLKASAHRLNAQMAASLQQAHMRQLAQATGINTVPQRSSAPTTPASAVQQQQQRQREREQSLGAETKRRKLGIPLAGVSIPSQPSSLRQSSLGPGTPKAGTPTGQTASRAGSIPRVTAVPQAGAVVKKSGLTKKVVSHQQVNKLKGKHTKHARLSSAGRKKGVSPSVRGGRAGTAASEDGESVLSSADASETDVSQTRARRGQKKAKAATEDVDVEMADEEEHEDEEADDDTRYCFCNERSYGEMVACENNDCKFQWFHTGCLNMKKVPDEDEDWYCPACRDKPEVLEKIRLKKKAGRK